VLQLAGFQVTEDEPVDLQALGDGAINLLQAVEVAAYAFPRWRAAVDVKPAEVRAQLQRRLEGVQALQAGIAAIAGGSCSEPPTEDEEALADAVEGAIRSAAADLDPESAPAGFRDRVAALRADLLRHRWTVAEYGSAVELAIAAQEVRPSRRPAAYARAFTRHIATAYLRYSQDGISWQRYPAEDGPYILRKGPRFVLGVAELAGIELPSRRTVRGWFQQRVEEVRAEVPMNRR